MGAATPSLEAETTAPAAAPAGTGAPKLHCVGRPAPVRVEAVLKEMACALRRAGGWPLLRRQQPMEDPDHAQNSASADTAAVRVRFHIIGNARIKFVLYLNISHAWFVNDRSSCVNRP